MNHNEMISFRGRQSITKSVTTQILPLMRLDHLHLPTDNSAISLLVVLLCSMIYLLVDKHLKIWKYFLKDLNERKQSYPRDVLSSEKIHKSYRLNNEAKSAYGYHIFLQNS